MAQIAIVAVMALMALNEGAQKRKQLVAKADAFSDAANRRNAAMTAEMAEEIKNKLRMESRAIAVAAASGAGVDDPTIVNLIGDLNAEGEYRVMSRLYVGEDEAEGLRQQSYAATREGEAALNAGYVGAVKSVMSLWGGKPTTPASAPSGHEAVRAIHGGTGAMGTSAQGLPFSPSSNPPPTAIWGN